MLRHAMHRHRTNSTRPCGRGSARAPSPLRWLLCCGCIAVGSGAQAGAADALRALHDEAAPRLRDSPFGAPITIASTQTAGRIEGEILARLDHPWARLERALGDPAHWCGILQLQPNVRGCRVQAGPDGAHANGSHPRRTRLMLRVGRRFDQPLRDTEPVELDVAVERSADHLSVRLHADRGPLGTRDYTLTLEAAPLEAGRSVVRVGYGQRYGVLAKVAAQAYFAGAGRQKVGFSTVEDERTGAPEHVGGLRGAVERNAMRHYLAVDAWLQAFERPPPDRFGASLRHWLDSIGRHPLQLAEQDPDAYAAVKRAQSHGTRNDR